MRWLLFLTLLLNWSAAFGQEKTLTLPGKLPSPQMDIGPYTTFYKDVSGDTLPLAVIQTNAFRPFAEKRNERTELTKRSVFVTWLRFTIHNTHPTDTLRLLYQTGAHGLITLYESNRLIGQTGLVLSPQRQPSRFALSLSVPPGIERIYIGRVIDYFWSPTPVFSELLTEAGSVQEEFGKGYVPERLLLAVMSVLTGFLLLMFLYALYSLLLTNERAFLYYSLYTLVGVLVTLNWMDYRFSFALLLPLQMSDVLSPFSFAPIVALYTLFIVEMLAIKTQFPLTWRLLKGLLVLLIMLTVFNLAEWIHARPFFIDYTVYDYIQTVPGVLTTGVLLSALVRSHSPIRYYLLLGMFSLLGIGFIPSSLDMYFANLSPLPATFVNYPYFWIVLGLATEAFCFLLALAYRSRLIELENTRIQQRYAHDLEAQLAQRTLEIRQQSRLLEQQHIRQLETEFEQKLADTEMTALRAQMNPHFIFNCLNSIKLYTTENDSEKASEYLTKFSRLIRLVLENSRSERVKLQNELDMLQLYADLEIMRFKQKLSFSIEVAPDLDTRFLEIPPLLLQPYVENAIWHGLMHKPEGGSVRVRATQPHENLLQLTITDDGVGRARAAELKSKSASHQKSFGLKITSERIALVNQLYQTHTQAQIFDLVAPDGEPLGTKVVLDIPV